MIEPQTIVAYADNKHKQNKTPINEIIKEYLKEAEFHKKLAKAYGNAAIRWELERNKSR